MGCWSVLRRVRPWGRPYDAGSDQICRGTQRLADGFGDGERSEAIPAIGSDSATVGERVVTGRLQLGPARHANHGGAPAAHRDLGPSHCTLALVEAGD